MDHFQLKTRWNLINCIIKRILKYGNFLHTYTDFWKILLIVVWAWKICDKCMWYGGTAFIWQQEACVSSSSNSCWEWLKYVLYISTTLLCNFSLTLLRTMKKPETKANFQSYSVLNNNSWAWFFSFRKMSSWLWIQNITVLNFWLLCCQTHLVGQLRIFHLTYS